MIEGQPTLQARPILIKEEAAEYIRRNGSAITIGFYIQESGCA